jgi:Uma2 family endonuclease
MRSEHDPQATSMTLDEWARLDEDQPGELVGGYLEEEEVASFVHEWLVAVLARRFQDWLRDRGLVVTSDAKLAIAENQGRKPDLSVWFPGSPRPRLSASVSSVPPDVAVEVVTPTPRDARRDRVTKYDEYAAFGVRFYWIVDPELRTVEVFALREGTYTRVVGASEGQALPVPGIDGAAFDLDAIWSRLDELLAEEER